MKVRMMIVIDIINIQNFIWKYKGYVWARNGDHAIIQIYNNNQNTSFFFVRDIRSMQEE